MEKYDRVVKKKEERTIDANEIRITSMGRARNYITYAMTLLQEKGSTEVVFKAMGRAINKTVNIVELVKRRIPGLHQNTSIGSTDITDTWEPKEEGLLPIETTRHVSMITIVLSTKELNTSAIGYQSPIPIEMVKPLGDIDYEGGNAYANDEYEDEGLERNQYDGRGRGRGRGRSGRGRGGYSGPPNEYDAPQDRGYGYDAPHEHRGYDDHGGYDVPHQGRGGYNGRHQGRGGYNGRQGRGGYDGPRQDRGGYSGRQGRGGYDGPHQGRGGYDGPHQGRGGYDGPHQGRGGYDGPHQGRGGYDGPQGSGDYDAPPQGRGNNSQNRGLFLTWL
ncbi:Alba DNA/RNA-binding protein [Raphanus sativus]|nr:Alba DNA/RNA-binding protein [Raphanus sativus]